MHNCQKHMSGMPKVVSNLYKTLLTPQYDDYVCNSRLFLIRYLEEIEQTNKMKNFFFSISKTYLIQPSLVPPFKPPHHILSLFFQGDEDILYSQAIFFLNSIQCLPVKETKLNTIKSMHYYYWYCDVKIACRYDAVEYINTSIYTD